MTKFNTTDKRGKRTPAPIKTNPVSTGHTYNGAPGYEYDTLSQLFLLACSNMVGEDTFYEYGKVRDKRYIDLIDKAVGEGHIDWLNRFFPWLRNNANMRSAALVGALETAHAMATLEIPGGRQLVNNVLTRADEPGEALAYWMGKYGRRIPKPIKRGIADAAQRLYTQRNTIKYDTDSKGLRFGDVLELTHAGPSSFDQSDLFKYLVTRGKGRVDVEVPDSLTMLVANEALRKQAQSTPELLLNTTRLHNAGMTWEAAKSLVGKRVSDKAIWEALIPTMGYMALLRNLRNFEEAKINGAMVDWVKNKLRDPAEVAASRQLPMRFLSAYRNVVSNQYSQALEEALDLCLGNVPQFAGRTLILIDTSYSMNVAMSAKSQLKRWDTAAIFGLALAHRCEHADVVSFSTQNKAFPMVKGESLLRSITRFQQGYMFNNSTATGAAVRDHYRGHDRVVVLTDEQANEDGWDVFAPVPGNKMVFTFNLSGDKMGHAATGPNRVAVGGLSDAAFTLMSALEGRGQGVWPF